ncbi:MAG: hypothetical protein DRI40_08225 [Chloroflexi bacterium]|nr:MAG: hypothetical protein DRI40_08225 [Chloroflexota bacterium]
MNPGKQLHDLQEIDLDLEEKNARLSHVERELSDDRALAEARERLEALQQQLAELDTRQREAEWGTDDLQAKLKPLRQKLYDGSVKNPKELSSLQQQVEQLKRQLRQEEDRTLDIMAQVEALQSEIAAQKSRIKGIEEEWRRRQEGLLAQKAELVSLIEAARERRDAAAAACAPAHLELYETLRARKQGSAVARVEQGRCGGCRITLSMSSITRARAADLVQCDSCGRILYVG